jgi:hypothetical protein
MKKYRSLWYMSTTNHNILYFPVIPCTLFLNTGICLWKAQNSLARRGLQTDFASNPVQDHALGQTGHDPHPLRPYPKA